MTIPHHIIRYCYIIMDDPIPCRNIVQAGFKKPVHRSAAWLVQFFLEIRVLDSSILHQVDIAFQQVLQCEFEIKVIFSIDGQWKHITIENNHTVDIAALVEPVRQNQSALRASHTKRRSAPYSVESAS